MVVPAAYSVKTRTVADAGGNHLIGGAEVGGLGVAAALDVAHHLGQHVDGDVVVAALVHRHDVDGGAQLPDVAGDLAHELRALIDGEDRALLVAALAQRAGVPLRVLLGYKAQVVVGFGLVPAVLFPSDLVAFDRLACGRPRGLRRRLPPAAYRSAQRARGLPRPPRPPRAPSRASSR